MQSSKTSNKTRAKAKEINVPVTTEQATQPRVTKASGSSQSKNEPTSEATAARHRKVQPTVEQLSNEVTPTATNAVVTTAPPQDADSVTVSREEIAKLAHSFWVMRNYAPGSPEEDWLRAESQLKSMTASA